MQYRRSVPPGILFLILTGFLGFGASNFGRNIREASRLLTWRILSDQNEPQARHEDAYIEVDGKFYLMGGRGTKPVQRYNPSDSTWSNRSYPPGGIQIHHFQPVAIGDVVYIVSAYTGTFPDEPTVNNIYKYIVSTDQWLVGSEIPADRRRGSAGVALYKGKIYVVGGSTGGHGDNSVRKNLFDEYDPATDTWTSLPNAPNARDHAHAVVIGDKLYYAGGRNGGNGDNVVKVDVYNFVNKKWSTLPSPAGDIPTPRAGATAVAVGNFVVVIGGESTQELAHNEVEALNTVTDTWITMQPLNVGRHGTQAIFFDDNIYIVAGSGNKGGSPELSSQEILETHGDTNLPVELAPDFSARVDARKVTLTWRTLSESNNAGFEVQHRLDGKFVSTGFVNGAGTSAIGQYYRFEIENLPPGRHAFRLKQVDFDGRFQYSPEVFAVIDVEGAYHLGRVYPNPLNPQARFDLTVARTQHVNVQVFDMLGRSVATVFDGSLTANEPQNFVLQSNSWAGGKYLLVARGAHFTASESFTVLK